MPGSPEKSAEMSSSVFIWKAINIEKESLIDEVLSQAWNIKVTFDVSNVIKWEKNKNITIKTANNSAACWFNFEENNEYIVYASWEKWDLRTYLCSRTSEIRNASEDIEAFEEVLSKDITLKENNDSKLNYKNIYLVLIIISLIVIISMKRKKDKEESEKTEEKNK